MAQENGEQYIKNTNKVKYNDLECWQINLHRCKAASYSMSEATKNVQSGLILIQEPWTYGNKIRGRPRGWNLFQKN